MRSPAPDDLPIFLDRATADAIERHALRDTSVELGGILLGKECVDDQTGEPFVWVTKSLEAKHYENTQASFTYTHDSWEEITRERDRLHPDLDIVGWYHTHPDFGVFLSSHDLFIQHHFFGQPLQVAYVVDPIRQTRGFFRWRDGAMEQAGGFYLTADRGERVALVRLVNDLENSPTPPRRRRGPLPSTGGRADRHAHPTRRRSTTAPPPPTGPDSPCSSACSARCSASWASPPSSGSTPLNGQIQEQAASSGTATRRSTDSADRQRLALDAAVGRRRRRRPRGFLERYARPPASATTAENKLEQPGSTNDLLDAQATSSSASEHARLDRKYETAKQFEKDAKEAAELRTRSPTSRPTERASRPPDRRTGPELLDTPEGRRPRRLPQSSDAPGTPPSAAGPSA